VLLRLQMKLPSLDVVRLLKPRLGFGAADVYDAPDLGVGTLVIQTEELATLQETQVSLVRLSDQLEQELLPVPLLITETSSESGAPGFDLKQVAEEENSGVELAPAESKLPAGLLEGCRVGAIGFGRQDIAGLAGAMMEERARVEFLPRGEIGAPAGFDLFLLNCASVDTLKRDTSSFRSVLNSGIPTIVIGSRAAINVLRGSGDPRTWDFAAKPLHMDELIWRAVNLLSRHGEEVLGKLPPSVVVADSDPFTRTLIESALSRQGFACELVEDGEAAWTAIEKSQPGAVILDLTLPNRDGFQLMADIRRAAGRKPRVIVLSARQSEADILRAFALGADDYLTKPFSPLELSARLMRLVGGAPENA
jgi:CheY-like chemotaxis protein